METSNSSPPSPLSVCSSSHLRPTHLGNVHRLLLHGLVDRGAVHLLDAVELVNAAEAAVGQDEGAGLQRPLAALLKTGWVVVLVDRGCWG
jgi:hypothetical protein